MNAKMTSSRWGAERDPCHSGSGIYPSDCELTQGLLEMANRRNEALARAKLVKLLLLDVDGVLTDGTITYSQTGEEVKSFHTKDGFGIRLLQQAGLEVGLITARGSKALSSRAADLSLTLVFQNVRDKVQIFEKLMNDLGLTREQVAYMGDDWLDLGLLRRVGFAVTVADAAPEVLRVIHHVTERPGGRGAVRELCDFILAAKGLQEELLARYL